MNRLAEKVQKQKLNGMIVINSYHIIMREIPLPILQSTSMKICRTWWLFSTIKRLLHHLTTIFPPKSGNTIKGDLRVSVCLNATAVRGFDSYAWLTECKKIGCICSIAGASYFDSWSCWHFLSDTVQFGDASSPSGRSGHGLVWFFWGHMTS